jgi:hypothetical protein
MGANGGREAERAARTASCKKRGFCPSCGARRMVETAALLADDVLPLKALRQWVLSLPFGCLPKRQG